MVLIVSRLIFDTGAVDVMHDVFQIMKNILIMMKFIAKCESFV